jgi:hypothetical protein
VQACAFAEGYITILVSCTPAIYSFYSNIFITSSFYSNLRSTFSRGKGSQASSNTPSKVYAASDDSGSSKGFRNGTREYTIDVKSGEVARPGSIAVGTEEWAGHQNPGIWKHMTFERASMSVKEPATAVSPV